MTPPSSAAAASLKAATPSTAAPARPAFGTILAPTMVVARFRDGRWSSHETRPVGPIELHPAAHVLHYASSCFEGFKAYRWADGSINVFRMDRHIERMRQSARALVLPEPDAAQLAQMMGASSFTLTGGFDEFHFGSHTLLIDHNLVNNSKVDVV